MMKVNFYAWMMAVLATAVPAWAELKPIPKEREGRWGVYTFEEAKAEAQKKRRPLAVLVVDHKAEEASVKEAGEKAFWAVQKDASVVVVISNLLASGKGRMGETVYGALTSAAIGKGMPRMVVTTADATVVLGSMTTEQIMAADEKALAAFIKEMEKAGKNPAAQAQAAGAAPKAAVEAPAAGRVTIKNPVAEAWTNTAGTTIQAALVEVADDEVVFLMANGARVNYAVANLSDASKKRLEALKASQGN